jgi:hypothetical protein
VVEDGVRDVEGEETKGEDPGDEKIECPISLVRVHTHWGYFLVSISFSWGRIRMLSLLYSKGHTQIC